VLTLLEELGAPYELSILNLKAGEQRQSSFLTVNPLGKVPAILHRGTLVTEQVAIFIYLADLFPKAGLAPAVDDGRRGSYLRWLVYYAACLEPAVTDKALGREPGPPAMSPYGDYDHVVATLEDQLRGGPYLLGGDFSAADILWGGALTWMIAFKLIPDNDVFRAYAERIAARPAAIKIARHDETLAAIHERAVEAAREHNLP
jgi:glutathione S-transferase